MILDAEETGDKKIIWELNRHQHFFTLGVAYWLTDDERFAETFARHLESWMDAQSARNRNQLVQQSGSCSAVDFVDLGVSIFSKIQNF